MKVPILEDKGAQGLAIFKEKVKNWRETSGLKGKNAATILISHQQKRIEDMLIKKKVKSCKEIMQKLRDEFGEDIEDSVYNAWKAFVNFKLKEPKKLQKAAKKFSEIVDDLLQKIPQFPTQVIGMHFIDVLNLDSKYIFGISKSYKFKKVYRAFKKIYVKGQNNMTDNLNNDNNGLYYGGYNKGKGKGKGGKASNNQNNNGNSFRVQFVNSAPSDMPIATNYANMVLPTAGQANANGTRIDNNVPNSDFTNLNNANPGVSDANILNFSNNTIGNSVFSNSNTNNNINNSDSAGLQVDFSNSKNNNMVQDYRTYVVNVFDNNSNQLFHATQKDGTTMTVVDCGNAIFSVALRSWYEGYCKNPPFSKSPFFKICFSCATTVLLFNDIY